MLTKEEVLHVADLAKININEDEIEKYEKQLNDILKEMQRINEVNIEDNDILISPTLNKNVYREDIPINDNVDVLKNAPKTNGNYIEIKRVVND